MGSQKQKPAEKRHTANLTMGTVMLRRLPVFALILLSIWSVRVFALPFYIEDRRYISVNIKNKEEIGQVVYAAEPVGRGTVGILISCTATYIFCVWTSLRPNILAGSTRKTRLWYKVVMVMFAILMPEGIMVSAYGERQQARRLRKNWEKKVEKTHHGKALERAKAKFPMEAAYFVVMGGFLINRTKLKFPEPEREGVPLVTKNKTPGWRHPPPTTPGSTSTKSAAPCPDGPSKPACAGSLSDDQIGADPTRPGLSQTPDTIACTHSQPPPTSHKSSRHSSYTIVGTRGSFSPACTEPEEEKDLLPGEYRTVITPAGFRYCLEHNLIDGKSFDRHAMADKGKANMVGKVLASAQALWLVVQSLARWRSDPQLPLTLLEVHVLLQLACAGFTYICWWDKPLDVAEPIVVTLNTPKEAEKTEVPSFDTLSDIKKQYYRSKDNTDLHFLTTGESDSTALIVMLKAFLDITSPLLGGGAGGNKHLLLVQGVLVVVVGGLHLLALGVYFITPVEHKLWLISCFCMVSLPFIAVPILYFTKNFEDRVRTVWNVRFGAMADNDFLKYALNKTHRFTINQRNEWLEKMNIREGPWKTFVGGCCILFQYTLSWTCIIILLAVNLSSLYLTVESYLAMRGPPVEAFQTPRWTDFLPHVG